MELLEQIDETQIREVISFSQDIENPNVESLLRDWARAKKNMAKTFLEGKISYTYPEKVRFELDEKSKEDKLTSFIEYISNLFSDWSHPLVSFLEDLSFEEFYANTLLVDRIIHDKKIFKNSKVIKSFKYFISDISLLHDLQNKASELIQENKVEGYLTFSIHPLDFLSSSENTYNWRSCHALDGEYRAGNLSYMCDSSTMIVYLSSNEPAQLPHFPPSVPWNSKKWRVLLHFDTRLEVCFAGRQYPFFAQGGLEVVKQIFSNELAPYFVDMWNKTTSYRQKWAGWYNDYIDKYNRTNGEEDFVEEDRYIVLNHGIYDTYSIIHDAENSRHFNDVLRSSCYEKPYYMYKEYAYPVGDIDIEVGAPVLCLRCGERIIESQDTMMCIDCECEFGDSDGEEYKSCDCCGTRFYWEDGSWVDDDLVCPHCRDTETFICEICGIRHYNSEKHWCNRLSSYICDSCYEIEEEE